MARVFPFARPGKLRCSLIVTGPGHYKLIFKTMKTSHTPGNWYVKQGPHEEQISIFSDVAGRTVLATKAEHWPASFEESNANFKLMSAAPELLHSLELLLDSLSKLEGKSPLVGHCINIAEKAIKKATK